MSARKKGVVRDVLLKMCGGATGGNEGGGGPCSHRGPAVEAPRAILTFDSHLLRSPSALFQHITERSDLTSATEGSGSRQGPFSPSAV